MSVKSGWDMSVGKQFAGVIVVSTGLNEIVFDVFY